MKRATLIVVAFFSVSAGTAWPIDQVYTTTSKKVFIGQIITTTATVVNFEGRGAPREIPANEITRIIFENSPEALQSAQKCILDAEFEKAIDYLKKATPEDKRREMAEEIAFCGAYCRAQLALSGAVEPVDAAKQMLKFITNSPNSFHYYRACELMGDLYAMQGKIPDAQKYYAKLGEAPWPDYKIRAHVALGRSYLAQGNAASAEKAFDEALASDAPGELAGIQRTSARIGKARCMVIAGKTGEAIESLNEIVDRTEEKTPEISAMAYNALGTALRKAGKPKEAIRAFLHVHLEYSTLPDLDAEAVANLCKLFTEDHKPLHARDMQKILDENYANSRWAKGVK